jgi:hypothetical protein
MACTLACNYLAFQVELFDAENEANHPVHTSPSGIASSSLTWESFDKDNAPQAFVVHVELRISCILVLPSDGALPPIPQAPFQIIRDKSPPHPASSVSYT